MLPAAAHLLGWVAQSSCSVLSQTFLGCMQWHRRCNDGWIRSLPDVRGQRVFFLKDPLALGTPGPKKHRAPFQPSRTHHWWDTTRPAATPAFTAPAPAWASSLPALALPGQALLPVPSQHSPPHLAPLHACCTAPAPLLDPIPQPSPPHSIPATEPLPTLLDPSHSLAYPTSSHSTPQPCLTPLDPCY